MHGPVRPAELPNSRVPSSGSTIHTRGAPSLRRSSTPSERTRSSGRAQRDEEVVAAEIAVVAERPALVGRLAGLLAQLEQQLTGPGGELVSQQMVLVMGRGEVSEDGHRIVYLTGQLLACGTGWPRPTNSPTSEPWRPKPSTCSARGGSRVRATRAAVLRRQGLDRDAAAGDAGLLARPCPSRCCTSTRSQLRRGHRLPRPHGRRPRRAVRLGPGRHRRRACGRRDRPRARRATGSRP